MTLDSIVREYLIEASEPEHKYFKALQFAISGLRELHYDVIGVPVIKNLTVNSDSTVDLPADYVSYVRLGVTNLDGTFHPLGINRNIALNRNLNDCGILEQRPNVDTDGDTYFIPGYQYTASHFRNGENVGRYYGYGGGQNRFGYFNIDTTNNQIQLSLFEGDTITIEYISDPLRADEEYNVHPFAVETLKAWIRWKMVSSNPNRPLQAGMIEKKEFTRNIKITRARFKSFSVEDMLEAFRKGNKAAPKF